MNRPSDYRSDIKHEGKMTNANFLEKYGTKTYAGAISGMTKTTFTIWLQEDVKITFDKKWRTSHQNLELGEVVKFSIQREESKGNYINVLKFENKNNGLINYADRNLKKTKKAKVYPLTIYDAEEMNMTILRQTDQYIWANTKWGTHKLRKPKNKYWEDKPNLLEFKVLVYEYEVDSKDSEEKIKRRLLKNIIILRGHA